MKKLQPGDKYNKFQAKKKARVAQKDPASKKVNAQLVKIAQDSRKLKKVAIMGLI